jgi:hypothetical protein
MRPELVKEAVQRLMDAHLDRLRQYEALHALALNNANVRVGSGGYGYTDALPGDGFPPEAIAAKNLWGCSTAQIFSEVSPEMHREFALAFEIQWLERFGLNYYGCCEPLHDKIEILEAIPRLRKVSMSPWADAARGAEQLQGRYVYSMKPNPAIVAESGWDADRARAVLRRDLEAARGCAVEVILKDITTAGGEPRRLHEWAGMAAEVTQAFA